MSSTTLNTQAQSQSKTAGVPTTPDSIAPIQPAQDVLGTLTMGLAPAAESNIRAAASLKEEHSDHIYSYSTKVRWQEKNYRLTIDFPCENWKSLNRNHLEAAADEYAAYFLADLKETLDADKKIKPGDDFEILFQGDQGYTAFVAPSHFNPLTATPETLKNLEKVVEAKSVQSQALAKIIETESDSYAKSIYKSLASSSALEPLREKINKQRKTAAITSDPINLQHKNNNCFINAAFQYLVNDPNPKVSEALRDPSNYKKGLECPLYQAICLYDKYQELGKAKCDINAILGIDDKREGDAIEVLGKFEDCFSEDAPQDLRAVLEMPAPAEELYFESSADLEFSSKEEELTSLEGIIADRFELRTLDDLPDDMNIHVPRITYEEETSEITKDDAPIIIGEDGKVTIKTKDKSEKTYDLVKFIAHTGSAASGHYVTYLRKGDKYWLLDDNRGAITISSQAFLDAARKYGCYYRLSKEQSNSTSDKPIEEEKKAEVSINEIIEAKAVIHGTAASYSEEKGSMNVDGFTLVHPSTKHLLQIHPQLKEVVDFNLLQEQIQTTGVYKKTYAPRSTWFKFLDFGPDIFFTSSPKPVLHIPLDPLKTKKDVQQATKDVLQYATENKKRTIAFPVFECENESEKDVVDWMKEAIIDFTREDKHIPLWREGHIKIIRPVQTESAEPEEENEMDVSDTASVGSTPEEEAIHRDTDSDNDEYYPVE